MRLTVVLAVGQERSLLAAQSAEWKSAGYIVQCADSIREAINHSKAGDFDLVLLGGAISPENRERLTFLIRASGAQTPVVLMESRSAGFDLLADATLKSDSSEILTGQGEFLGRTDKLGAVGATILCGNASLGRSEGLRGIKDHGLSRLAGTQAVSNLWFRGEMLRGENWNRARG